MLEIFTSDCKLSQGELKRFFSLKDFLVCLNLRQMKVTGEKLESKHTLALKMFA